MEPMKNIISDTNFETSFPVRKVGFFKADDFQDKEVTVTYVGWKKKSNDDRPARGKAPATTWKHTLKYVLKYSYPEFATDEAGEKIIGRDGKPWKNKNYDPAHPRGYTCVYKFEEGEFDTGSYPLFKAFCMVQPAPGDRLVISKTGKDKETKWKVKKVNKDHSVSAFSDSEVPDVDFDSPSFSGDPEVNNESVPF